MCFKVYLVGPAVIQYLVSTVVCVCRDENTHKLCPTSGAEWCDHSFFYIIIILCPMLSIKHFVLNHILLKKHFINKLQPSTRGNSQHILNQFLKSILSRLVNSEAGNIHAVPRDWSSTSCNLCLTLSFVLLSACWYTASLTVSCLQVAEFGEESVF